MKKYQNRTGRGRKSVAAERYNPEDDDDDDEPLKGGFQKFCFNLKFDKLLNYPNRELLRIFLNSLKVVPKSDEQRKRLIEVSKKIMLLSRLDEVKRKFSQKFS